MRNRIIYKIFTVVFIACFIFSMSLNVYATTQSDVNNLKDKQKQAESELNDIKSDKKDAQTELDKIVAQVDEVKDKIDDLKNQLEDLNDQITSKQEDITKGEKEIDAKNELLKERMVTLYEAGDTSYLDVLFNSDNIIDFMSGYSAIQTILEADTNLINELEDKKTQLEDDKKLLEDNKQKVQTVKGEQEIQNANLIVLKEKQQNEINKLSDDEKSKLAEVQNYKAEIKKGEDEIRERERQNENKKAGSASGNAVISTSSGTLAWPIEHGVTNYNVITSPFGWRKSPTAGASTYHGGVDIGVRYQTVYAAESGRVVVAGWVSGYGNYIKIKHDNGLYTGYGHLSKIDVSENQTVKRGQIIAVSGNTGVSTGPHLHFEVYDGGSSSSCRKNPLSYAHW